MITEVESHKIDIETLLSEMTRDEFSAYLSEHGIRKNTHRYQDYETAKRRVFRGAIISDGNLYDRLINWIANYVGV